MKPRILLRYQPPCSALDIGGASGFSGTLLTASAQAETTPPGGVLPSWNDGPAKQAIVDFVRATTDQASPKFVPPEERIATFDQDGTLWVEHPMYSQMMYCLDRVPVLAAAEAGTEERGAVQDRALRQSRGHGQADDAGS